MNPMQPTPKELTFGDESRHTLARGIAKMERAVSATMGAKGRNIVIDRGMFNDPTSTKDGVTVAREARMLPDAKERLGANIVYEASRRTNDEAGDGTTATIVLANEMIQEGLRRINNGSNAIQIKNGMLKAVDAAAGLIKKHSIEIGTKEQIERIATISAQDSNIGSLIAMGMMEVGEYGTITVDAQQGNTGLQWEFRKGMQISSGYVSPVFMTNEQKREYDMENVAIVVFDEPVRQESQIIEIVRSLVDAKKLHMLFVGDIQGEALNFLLLNRIKGNFAPCAVISPRYNDLRRDILKDIAVYTGATLICPDEGVNFPKENSEANIALVGFADRVIVGKNNMAITGGHGEQKKIAKRVEEIKATLKSPTDEAHEEEIKERLARFTSGVGIIRCGGQTDFQTEEIRFRVDDALCAARAAVEEGIVAGGGKALLNVYKEMGKKMPDDLIGDERIGWEIVMQSMKKPAQTIARVAGLEEQIIVHEAIKHDNPNVGYNVLTDQYEDMVKSGIIDPAKVVRVALENAASVASTLLTTEGTLVDLPQNDTEERDIRKPHHR